MQARSISISQILEISQISIKVDFFIYRYLVSLKIIRYFSPLFVFLLLNCIYTPRHCFYRCRLPCLCHMTWFRYHSHTSYSRPDCSELNWSVMVYTYHTLSPSHLSYSYIGLQPERRNLVNWKDGLKCFLHVFLLSDSVICLRNNIHVSYSIAIHTKYL